MTVVFNIRFITVIVVLVEIYRSVIIYLKTIRYCFVRVKFVSNDVCEINFLFFSQN